MKQEHQSKAILIKQNHRASYSWNGFLYAKLIQKDNSSTVATMKIIFWQPPKALALPDWRKKITTKNDTRVAWQRWVAIGDPG